jgi:hypothetical protein
MPLVSGSGLVCAAVVEIQTWKGGVLGFRLCGLPTVNSPALLRITL